jgi:hypothetical protein
MAAPNRSLKSLVLCSADPSLVENGLNGIEPPAFLNSGAFQADDGLAVRNSAGPGL